MDMGRAAPIMAVGVITLLTLSSGPVGVVDFTTEQDATAGLGEGRIVGGSVDMPSTAALQQGGYGSQSYYLQVPDAVLTVERVEGRPVVSYKVNIPELGYSRETAHFLSEGMGPRISLSVEKDTLRPSDVQQDEYAGELLVVSRIDHNSTVLERRNVTVEVRR
jgi:hypothetical protein